MMTVKTLIIFSVLLASLFVHAAAATDEVGIRFKSGWMIRSVSDEFITVGYGSNAVFMAKLNDATFASHKIYEFLVEDLNEKLDSPPTKEEVYVYTREASTNKIAYYGVSRVERIDYLINRFSSQWKPVSEKNFNNLIDEIPILQQDKLSEYDTAKMDNLYSEIVEKINSKSGYRTAVEGKTLPPAQVSALNKPSSIQEAIVETLEPEEEPSSFPWLWNGAIVMIAGVVAFLVFQRQRT